MSVAPLRCLLIALWIAASGVAQEQIEEAERLVETGRRHEAFSVLEQFLEDSPGSSLGRYRLAEICFIEKDYQRAANEFRECLIGDRKPQWTLVWAHIKLGKIYDLARQRSRALHHYRLAARTGDDTQKAQVIARRYLEQPYDRP